MDTILQTQEFRNIIQNIFFLQIYIYGIKYALDKRNFYFLYLAVILQSVLLFIDTISIYYRVIKIYEIL